MSFNKSFLGDKDTRQGYTTNKNLVMLNFQPMYRDIFTFDPNHLNSYIKSFSNILYLYEEESEMQDVYQMQAFLEDTCGVDERDIIKFEMQEKTDDFFLDFIDLNIKEKNIIQLIKYMGDNKKTLEEVNIDDYNKLLISKELSYGKFKEQQFYIPDIYYNFKFNNFVFIGGPEEDSLWEYKLMFDALKLKYELDYDFIF